MGSPVARLPARDYPARTAAARSEPQVYPDTEAGVELAAKEVVVRLGRVHAGVKLEGVRVKDIFCDAESGTFACAYRIEGPAAREPVCAFRLGKFYRDALFRGMVAYQDAIFERNWQVAQKSVGDLKGRFSLVPTVHAFFGWTFPLSNRTILVIRTGMYSLPSSSITSIPRVRPNS